ncbi:MAG: hypothetical protein JNG88_03625 [Phycisphaerales bacterium]|nr:hypothetical protein [Phycisphaerales bacterium]
MARCPGGGVSLTVEKGIETSPIAAPLIERMRGIALRSLPRMYRPEVNRFGWCLRKMGEEVRLEGESLRYTAITAIGLASEEPETASGALHGATLTHLVDHLVKSADVTKNLGDAALIHWAAVATENAGVAESRDRVLKLLAQEAQPYTVELSWVVTALSLDTNAPKKQRDDSAARLLGGFSLKARAFPHRLGAPGGLRGHVSCFADLVYPIQALSHYHATSGDIPSLRAADACADLICERMGAAGQWWWHYDYRTGAVIENYPVYAVHQDAMAPMALLTLAEAGGRDHSHEIQRGLNWLESSPELNGGSLIDSRHDVIWRKIARREPNKLVRKIRAATTRAVQGWRVSALDAIFPPGLIDWETRPYHMGWLLHAFTPARAARGYLAGGPA